MSTNNTENTLECVETVNSDQTTVVEPVTELSSSNTESLVEKEVREEEHRCEELEQSSIECLREMCDCDDETETESYCSEEDDDDDSEDDENEDDIEHMYVLSIDDTPLFYTDNETSAYKRMTDLASRYNHRHVGGMYSTRFEEVDYNVIKIYGRLNFAITSYDRVLHVLRYDRVDRLC